MILCILISIESNFVFETIDPKDLNSTTSQSNLIEEEHLVQHGTANLEIEQQSQQSTATDRNKHFNSEDSYKLTQDNEGFDDVDEYFNQAVTPQRTPKSQNQNLKSTAVTPKTPLPSSLLGNNVLIAKPVKMISSKIAAHYKKEPRLAVSMSEVEAEEREKQRIEDAIFQAEAEKLSIAQKELELMKVDSNEENYNHEAEYFSNNTDTLEDEQDVQYEHEELKYQSVTNSQDQVQQQATSSSIIYDHYAQNKDFNDTDIQISQLIKTQVISDNNGHEGFNDFNDDNGPVPDDVLMDRLVEEMLVNDQIIQEEVEVEEIQPKAKRGKSVGGVKRNKTQPRDRNTSKVERQGHSKTLSRRPPTYFPGTMTDDLGFRKSCRQRFTPLRYWANEKVCYGRADDPSITLPVIVQVIKKPELDDPTFATGMASKKRRNNTTDLNAAKMKAQAFGPDCDVEAPVLDYNTGEEEERLIALSHHHVQADLVKDSTFRIHTIFTEGAYMSAGQLHFPPEAQKPTKNSARHALVFYVVNGSFRVEINRTSFVIGPGGQFHVPRSNHYTITHISTDKTIEGRLFFCHCKDNSESN